MQLRTRLTLIFATVAIIPAAAVAWVTLSSVEASFETMLEARLDDVESILRAELARTAQDIDRAVVSLSSEAPDIIRLASELRLGLWEESAAVPLAERLMAGRRDLDALMLLDGEGRVLSSGHLPARTGDHAPGLLALAANEPGQPRLRWIEVRRGHGETIGLALALLVSRPAGKRQLDSAPIHVVGGRLVDDAFATRLSLMSGSSVRLLVAGMGDETSLPRPLAERSRRLPVTANDKVSAEIEFAVSEEALLRARRAILLALAGSSVLGVFASALLGTLLASRVTRPVSALAEGAGRIAEGDYRPVETGRASGEMLALIRAFNSMAVEVSASRDRIAAAERVAAWQGIARRLAHEIKNPLTPIAMSIETLKKTYQRRHPDFEEIFAESTQAILEEVESLRRLVSEFTSFARLPRPALGPVDAGSLLQAALGLFPEPPQGVRIDCEIAPDLPPIMADRDQLGQVLLNLLTNALQAIEAREDASGTVKLRARQNEEREEVVMDVEDDGPGIDPADLGEIFTPYFTTKDGGTGLGLAICHRIVAEHGGRMEVSSRPGHGALFSIVFRAASRADR